MRPVDIAKVLKIGRAHYLAAGKLKRVVMLVGTVQVDLPEPRDVFSQLLVREESERVIALDVADELSICRLTTPPDRRTATMRG
jgi:hypothetical protein